jgi:hypothetical protein
VGQNGATDACSVEGRVTSAETLAPLKNAALILHAPKDDAAYEAVTDSAGRFVLSGVAAGDGFRRARHIMGA